jgi:hypothetical protein
MVLEWIFKAREKSLRGLSSHQKRMKKGMMNPPEELA